MNQATEVKGIVSWLLTTGTARYYKEPGKRIPPRRNVASHTSDLQEKFQLNFGPPQPIQKNWKSPEHPLTQSFQPQLQPQALPYIATHCEAALPHKTLSHLQ